MLGGESRDSGAEVNYRHCPVCGSDEWKLYVNHEKGVWRCFAGRHNGAGSLQKQQSFDSFAEDLKKKLRFGTESVTMSWSECELPVTEPLGERALSYLAERGISDEWARRFHLREGTGKYSLRIIIPYFDELGRPIYFNTRAYHELADGPKYLTAPGKHPLYFPLRDASKPLVIVEGPFDAMKVAMAGYNAVALGGKFVSAYLRVGLQDAVHTAPVSYVFLDPDAISASTNLNRLYPSTIIKLTDKHDPGQLDPASIRNLLGGEDYES